MPAGRGRIPDRWEEYSAVGNLISGTRFIAFKVPLHGNIGRNLPENDRFNLDKLFDGIDGLGFKLGLVIDLTNTTRYYNAMLMESYGVRHVKIFTEGHVVPNKTVRMKFKSYVDDFLAKNAHNDLLIGVHCTHGVNRTGYLICRYMIDSLQFEPDRAIQAFQEGRGYPIERENYLNDLRTQKIDADDSALDIGDEQCDSSVYDHRNLTRRIQNVDMMNDVFQPVVTNQPSDELNNEVFQIPSERARQFSLGAHREKGNFLNFDSTRHVVDSTRHVAERHFGKRHSPSPSSSSQGRMHHSHSWSGKPYAPSQQPSSYYHQRSPHQQSSNGRNQRNYDDYGNQRFYEYGSRQNFYSFGSNRRFYDNGNNRQFYDNGNNWNNNRRFYDRGDNGQSYNDGQIRHAHSCPVDLNNFNICNQPLLPQPLHPQPPHHPSNTGNRSHGSEHLHCQLNPSYSTYSKNKSFDTGYSSRQPDPYSSYPNNRTDETNNSNHQLNPPYWTNWSEHDEVGLEEKDDAFGESTWGFNDI